MGKPDIRFKGYTDEWEQRKVSEIAIEKLSNGIMNNQSDDETGVKHINVINMYDTDKIHSEKLTFSNYDEEAVKKCNVEFGDIFLTRSSQHCLAPHRRQADAQNVRRAERVIQCGAVALCRGNCLLQVRQQAGFQRHHFLCRALRISANRLAQPNDAGENPRRYHCEGR